jgi:deoxyribose-phosphate aldolase
MLLNNQAIIRLIDLTLLDDHAQAGDIEKLCQQARTPCGTEVAAICVYAKFLPQVNKLLQGSSIKTCTVANFPGGQEDDNSVLNTIQQALNDDVDEIDVVLPYEHYLDGDKTPALEAMQRYRQAIPANKTMKVILETGALQSSALIAEACYDMIQLGVDFLKTSTGKIAQGASLEAAAIMLATLAKYNPEIGFKASGGVRSKEQAQEYIQLAQLMLGKPWVTAKHFRLGASSLLKQLV